MSENNDKRTSESTNESCQKLTALSSLQSGPATNRKLKNISSLTPETTFNNKMKPVKVLIQRSNLNKFDSTKNKSENYPTGEMAMCPIVVEQENVITNISEISKSPSKKEQKIKQKEKTKSPKHTKRTNSINNSDTSPKLSNGSCKPQKELKKSSIKKCFVHIKRTKLDRIQQEQVANLFKSNKIVHEITKTESPTNKYKRSNSSAVSGTPLKKSKIINKENKNKSHFFIKFPSRAVPSNSHAARDNSLIYAKSKLSRKSSIKEDTNNIPKEYNRSKLIEKYGSRFFRSYVKIKRCSLPVKSNSDTSAICTTSTSFNSTILNSSFSTTSNKKKNVKSKNLSVSFKDQVEWLGTDSESEDENINNDDISMFNSTQVAIIHNSLHGADTNKHDEENTIVSNDNQEITNNEIEKPSSPTHSSEHMDTTTVGATHDIDKIEPKLDEILCCSTPVAAGKNKKNDKMRVSPKRNEIKESNPCKESPKASKEQIVSSVDHDMSVECDENDTKNKNIPDGTNVNEVTEKYGEETTENQQYDKVADGNTSDYSVNSPEVNQYENEEIDEMKEYSTSSSPLNADINSNDANDVNDSMDVNDTDTDQDKNVNRLDDDDDVNNSDQFNEREYNDGENVNEVCDFQDGEERDEMNEGEESVENKDVDQDDQDGEGNEAEQGDQCDQANAADESEQSVQVEQGDEANDADEADEPDEPDEAEQTEETEETEQAEEVVETDEGNCVEQSEEPDQVNEIDQTDEVPEPCEREEEVDGRNDTNDEDEMSKENECEVSINEETEINGGDEENNVNQIHGHDPNHELSGVAEQLNLTDELLAGIEDEDMEPIDEEYENQLLDDDEKSPVYENVLHEEIIENDCSEKFCENVLRNQEIDLHQTDSEEMLEEAYEASVRQKNCMEAVAIADCENFSDDDDNVCFVIAQQKKSITTRNNENHDGENEVTEENDNQTYLESTDAGNDNFKLNIPIDEDLSLKFLIDGSDYSSTNIAVNSGDYLADTEIGNNIIVDSLVTDSIDELTKKIDINDVDVFKGTTDESLLTPTANSLLLSDVTNDS